MWWEKKNISVSFEKKKKFNLVEYCGIDSNICHASFLSDKTWYLVAAQALGESSWFPPNEAAPWNKPPVIAVMDLAVSVRPAISPHPQEIFYQPLSPACKMMNWENAICKARLHILGFGFRPSSLCQPVRNQRWRKGDDKGLNIYFIWR